MSLIEDGSKLHVSSNTTFPAGQIGLNPLLATFMSDLLSPVDYASVY